METKLINLNRFKEGEMKPHDSMRGYFAHALHEEMSKDKDIWVITGDLGYGMWDRIKTDYPDRFINTGAAEQAMMGIAVGLAMQGKKPFVYSITPFLLWRPAETIRLYVNHEQVPVRLVGGGRDDDYKHDGFSHNAYDAKSLLNLWPHIIQYWPNTKEEAYQFAKEMARRDQPQFISLSRGGEPKPIDNVVKEYLANQAKSALKTLSKLEKVKHE